MIKHKPKEKFTSDELDYLKPTDYLHIREVKS